jgi:hypothetical protein
MEEENCKLRKNWKLKKYLACNEDFETKITYPRKSRFLYVLAIVITKLLVDFQLLRTVLRGICIVTQTLIKPGISQRFGRSQLAFVRE